MAKIGIIYSISTKAPLRIIAPTRETELNDPLHVGVGEAILVVDDFPWTPSSCALLIEQHLKGEL